MEKQNQNHFQPKPLFSSFVQGGFECCAALTRGKRLQLLCDTKHDAQVVQDYTLLKAQGIMTVREGLAWSEIDQGQGRYIFDRFLPILEAGRQLNVQQIWDLNHFDYPGDINPFGEDFVPRFAEYAQQAVKLLRSYSAETLFIVPINEISFFAWIGADQGGWAPFKRGRKNGLAFKQQLVRASIQAMEAIWQVDQNVRFIQVDPFMRRVAVEPANAKARRLAQEFNSVIRFQAWDMLAGKTYPELGGNPKYLDIIGMNYYIHNQEWVFSEGRKIRHQRMDWQSANRVSFAQMVKEVFERYQRPILVSETGSFGENRTEWWQRVLEEVKEGLEQNLPILGVCAYPVLDRPESAGFLLPQSGLWDFNPDDPLLKRVPHSDSLSVIQHFQPQLNELVQKIPLL
jgi:beta-glucosidase/6-phospho-beta-glucosidase/beta-galactosidase